VESCTAPRSGPTVRRVLAAPACAVLVLGLLRAIQSHSGSWLLAAAGIAAAAAGFAAAGVAVGIALVVGNIEAAAAAAAAVPVLVGSIAEPGLRIQALQSFP